MRILPVHLLLIPQPNRLTLENLKASGDKGVVVFFAPEAAVVQHYVAHCLIAKALQERGHSVLIIRCFDVYPRCVVMDSVQFGGDNDARARRKICTSCVNDANSMAGEYGLDVLDLKDLADDAMRREVDELTSDLPEDLSTFEIEGVRLGKFCAAMAAVTFKVTDFAGVDPTVRALMIKYIKGALLSYRAMQRLAGSVKIVRVLHFNQYAILLAAALAARAAGIPSTNLTHASIRGYDRRRIVFFTDTLSIATFRRQLAEWPLWRNLALPEQTVREIADDCIYRMSSNSVVIYSPVRAGSVNDLHAKLNLQSDRRLLVAFTSSLDEILANTQYLDGMRLEPFPEEQPFRDQIEWLEALVERVEASSDLQLVVRTHPREGVNRRDSIIASHLQSLKQKFSRPFKYVRFIWAEEPVSSYDLMELADVGLSAWSFTALEMARLGVPTVVAFDRHTPFPIGDVVQWKADRSGYFQCLDEALRMPPSLDTIRFAFRWSNLRFSGCALDLGDVVPNSEFGGLPPYRTPRAAKAIEEVVVGGRTALDLNRQILMNEQSQEAEAKEDEALRQQLRRCIWFLCVGQDRSADYKLYYSSDANVPVPDGYDAVLTNKDGWLQFGTRDGAWHQGSRMAERLAMLVAQNRQHAQLASAKPVAVGMASQ